ncbi:MAG: helix-turn-helix domain-containing protein [Lachnospiraceae bacterium]|nr:helix-turn-helix domain-containing protein [Lachnospiraceae bacterium]
MVKERYLINEAAKEVHVESHVLRYWEEELGLPIKRNEQGHRIYTQEDIDRFIAIKDLKDQGLQLKAVKTILDQIHSDNGGDEDMRAGNPFAQKQLTKITKLGEAKMAAIKNSEDAKWNERFGRKHEAIADTSNTEEKNEYSSEGGRTDMKNMIEIKEMRSLDAMEGSSRTDYSQNDRLPEAGQAQTLRLQYLFQKLIKDAVAANNKEMADQLVARITENVKGDLCKELDYQFRLMEERDEERVNTRHELEDKRNEEYYKRIDELLRQYSGKNGRFKDKNKEKNKEKQKEKTIEFPNAKEKKEPKAKKEFHFFKKAVEAK